MKFMGSKARIAYKLLQVMLPHRKPNQWWVEPFVGGGNMIDKVDGLRLGGDVDFRVIEALTAIRDEHRSLPKSNKEFTEQDYKALFLSNDYKYKGYAGFALSFGGQWLNGWCRGDSRKGPPRDYVAEAYVNAAVQSRGLQGVQLQVATYNKLQIPPQSLIYCDPPYASTQKYRVNFDSKAFWSWCKKMAAEGHTVFVSEYSAPEGCECVWAEPLGNQMALQVSKRATEALWQVT